MRPPIGEMDSMDDQKLVTSDLFQPVKGLKLPKHIGLIDFRFGFLTGDRIVQQRYVKSLPIYPYDHELNGVDFGSEQGG